MAPQPNAAILAHLSHALQRISRIPPRVITSPPTQPRRASVAILLRIRPSPEDEQWLADQHDPEASQGDAMGASGVHLSQESLSPEHTPSSQIITRFFSQPWVQRGSPEILYIKRAARIGDKWSAHVAFPGGRREEGDENGLYTAMRETWEEVGIDLAETEFQCVGQLDDREITTSLGKRLLMVLSPYVFVQTSPFSPLPDLQPSEVASAHWIPLSLLYTPSPNWGTTSVDISSRLAPKSPIVRSILCALIGKMDFKCILLPNQPVAVAVSVSVAELDERLDPELSMITKLDQQSESNPQLNLWGLTLGMTLDLLSHMTTFESTSSFRSGGHTSTDAPIDSSPPSPSSTSTSTSTSTSFGPSGLSFTQDIPTLKNMLSEPFTSTNRLISRIRDECHLNPPPHARALAPSLTSVFPRFSYPDVNFWIWFFGWRYRNVVRRWQASIGTPIERRVNWSGLALGAFYSAVRRALVVAVLLRALGMLTTASIATWLTARRINRSRRGLPGFGLDELLS